MGTIATPSAKQVMLAGFLLKFSGLTPDKKLIQARVFIVFILMDVFPEYPYRYLKEPRGFMELSTPHKKHQTEKSGPIILSPPLSRSWAKPNKHCETKQKSYFHYHLS